MTIILQPMKPIAANATLEDRRRAFKEYKRELMQLNPRSFNADGSVKTTWQYIKGLFRNA